MTPAETAASSRLPDPKGVLCSGSIVFDTLVRPVDHSEWGTTTLVESIEYHLGGNGANTGLALALLGMPVRLLGSVGNDEQGRFALHRLQQAGVETDAVTIVDEPTAASIVIVNSAGARKFLHRAGASVRSFIEPVQFTPKLTAGIAHYHMASLFVLPRLRTHAPTMLADAQAAGLTTSVDINWDPQSRWMEDLRPCLPYVDFLFMNEDEARMITGTSDPTAAAAIVRNCGVQTAVMKLGGRGCALYTAEQQVHCPAFNVEVKDTTGAGDCFAAGFLSTILRGGTLAEAGRYANGVAALSVQKIGAVEGILPRAETEAWMQTARLRE